MNQPQEIILFNEQGVFTSNHRLILDNQTFAMRNISSVVIEHQFIKQSMIPLLVGLVLTVVGLAVVGLLWEASSMLVAILFGGSIIGVGAYSIHSWRMDEDKNIYWLCLTTNAGVFRAKGWHNRSFTKRVCGAINQAMMYK